MNRDCDIAIVGGGVVGGALAAALSGHGLEIRLIEARKPAAFDPAVTDLRVYALSLASQRILQAIGAWGAIAERRISPYREMHVWDAAGEGSIHFNAADIGAIDLGYIVEQALIQSSLLKRIETCEDIGCLSPVRAVSLSRTDGGAVLGLDDGSALSARLVVATDGADSAVRELAGIEVTRWDYHQKGVVSHIQLEEHHQCTARQRFLPGGPIALLPLLDGRCSIVWSVADEQASQLLHMAEPEFLAALTEATGACLGRAQAAGARAAFPLRAQYANRYVMERLALAGDAAHTVHPLAGQGVNLGLLDAAALAQVVIEAHDRGCDIGEAAILRRYERWRKGENLAMLGVLEGFHHLFRSQALPLRALRNVGMALVDLAGPVKNALVRRATGIAGDLPEMARNR